MTGGRDWTLLDIGRQSKRSTPRLHNGYYYLITAVTHGLTDTSRTLDAVGRLCTLLTLLAGYNEEVHRITLELGGAGLPRIDAERIRDMVKRGKQTELEIRKHQGFCGGLVVE